MPSHPSSPDDPSDRSSWLADAVEFLEARLALILSETRDAGQGAIKRLMALAILVICLCLGWGLLITGLIGLLASLLEHWRWFDVALAIAAGHFIIAGIAYFILRRPGPGAFPITRQELSKDRSWLNDLKKNKH